MASLGCFETHTDFTQLGFFDNLESKGYDINKNQLNTLLGCRTETVNGGDYCLSLNLWVHVWQKQTLGKPDRGDRRYLNCSMFCKCYFKYNETCIKRTPSLLVLVSWFTVKKLECPEFITCEKAGTKVGPDVKFDVWTGPKKLLRSTCMKQTGGDSSNKGCFGRKTNLFRESGDFAGNRETWEIFREIWDIFGTLSKDLILHVIKQYICTVICTMCMHCILCILTLENSLTPHDMKRPISNVSN